MSGKLGSYGMPVDVVPESIQQQFARIDKRTTLPLPLKGTELNEKIAEFAAEHEITFEQAVECFATGRPELHVLTIK